ncbi:MAG TPA: SPW repeat protein [Chloroflexota bacterium]|nr:SPW repeat protein [Chloroflexota bacterium]
MGGVWALALPASRAPQWGHVALGVWLFAAPWVLGFAGLAGAAWTAWVVGVCVAALALWAMAEAGAPGQRAPATGR